MAADTYKYAHLCVGFPRPGMERIINNLAPPHPSPVGREFLLST